MKAKAHHLEMPPPLPRNWAAEPCLDLINSRFNDHLGSGHVYDRIRNPAFQREFLRRWNYQVKRPTDPEAWARMARLRTLLRDSLELHLSGRRIPEPIRQRLELEANRAGMRWRLETTRRVLKVKREVAGRDWDAVTAQITLSAVRLMSERRQVKVCANPHCSWMFVDQSRSGMRRWCDASVCGSLHNVRRFRASHKSSQSRP
jgi:predicted RNA-binding Zn ribbon-like protein